MKRVETAVGETTTAAWRLIDIASDRPAPKLLEVRVP
jgi:hypothetical protein